MIMSHSDKNHKPLTDKQLTIINKEHGQENGQDAQNTHRENRLDGENTASLEDVDYSQTIAQETHVFAGQCAKVTDDSIAPNSVDSGEQADTQNHSDCQSVTTVPQLIDSVAQCADLPVHLKLAMQALLATIPKNSESPNSSP